MSRRRAALGAALVVLLGIVGLVIVPELALRRGHDAEQAAAELPLSQAWAPWDDALRAYRFTGRIPLYGHASRDAVAVLRRTQQARLATALRPLTSTADADAALAWLASLDQDQPPPDPRAVAAWRSDVLLAAGRPDAVLAAPPDPSPDDAARRRLAALVLGRVAELPDSLLGPGISALGGQPPPAGDDAATAAAAAMSEIAGHHYERAVAGLRPHVDQGDPLAAEALAVVLAAWQQADPAGLMTSGAELDPYAADRLALRSALLRSPSENPEWMGAWLAWTQLMLVRGDRDEARIGVWGALEASLPILAAPTPLLPVFARLDSPGSVPPARIQPVRAAIRDWREEALAAGDDALAADLRTAELSLELLQARAHVQVRELGAAHTRLGAAHRMDPTSPRVAAWLALTEALQDSPELAGKALAGLDPDLAETTAPAPEWIGSGTPDPAGLPSLLAHPWPPHTALATALAHPADDLPRLLRAPGRDGLDVAQALALAHLDVRVQRARDSDQLSAAIERRDALQTAVLALPLWGSLVGGAALPEPPPPAPLYP